MKNKCRCQENFKSHQALEAWTSRPCSKPGSLHDPCAALEVRTCVSAGPSSEHPIPTSRIAFFLVDLASTFLPVKSRAYVRLSVLQSRNPLCLFQGENIGWFGTFELLVSNQQDFLSFWLGQGRRRWFSGTPFLVSGGMSRYCLSSTIVHGFRLVSMRRRRSGGLDNIIRHSQMSQRLMRRSSGR